MLVGLIDLVTIVHAGAADNLGDDYALRAVNDKGAPLGHQREIAHEDLLLLDLARLFVQQTDPDLDGLGIRRVALFALFDGVLCLVLHGVVQEGELQIAGVVGDRRYILEYLLQAFFQEPVVGVALDLQQIGHVDNLLVLCITAPQSLTELDFLR